MYTITENNEIMADGLTNFISAVDILIYARIIKPTSTITLLKDNAVVPFNEIAAAYLHNIRRWSNGLVA